MIDVRNLKDLVEFQPGGKVRKRVFITDKIEMELVCYEPGTSTVEHHHAGQDEIFIIMEGTGTITVGGEAVRVGPGSLVYAPADIKHGIEPDRDGRMVMVFVKAPGRSARPGRAPRVAAAAAP
ncbi:MAG: cupin domain-containing protein [Candidatus Odyssella sp.]|nr:cupin domain-containing protein [Candidatus Odyssella sp.]